jgi:hypothetical protein
MRSKGKQQEHHAERRHEDLKKIVLLTSLSHILKAKVNLFLRRDRVTLLFHTITTNTILIIADNIFLRLLNPDVSTIWLRIPFS